MKKSLKFLTCLCINRELVAGQLRRQQEIKIIIIIKKMITYNVNLKTLDKLCQVRNLWRSLKHNSFLNCCLSGMIEFANNKPWVAKHLLSGSMYLVVFPHRDILEFICSTSSPEEAALPSCQRLPHITW